MGDWIRVRLIPQGYYARSWQASVLVTLANIHEEVHGSPVKCGEDSVYFPGPVEGFCESLSATFKTIVEDTETLIEALKVSAPKPGKNDKQVLQKTGITLGDDENYLQAFIKVINITIEELESENECLRHVRDLGVIRLARSRGEIEYNLGVEAGYAPLQPLKIEKHEYSKDFMNFAGVKGDLRTSKIWLAMLLAGWIRTYIGMGGGYLTFSLPPDNVLEVIICDPARRRVFEEAIGREPLGVKGYYKTPARIKGAGKPLEAYRILLALEALSYVNASMLLDVPPYRIIRIDYDGKTSRLIDDLVIDISHLLRAVARLKAIETASGVKLLYYIRKLAECSINAYHGRYTRDCRELFGSSSDVVSMVKVLHQAMTGAFRPEKAVYMLARLSPEPMGNVIPPFRSLPVVKALLDSLV